jgi:fucose 4-O-acetylase-like acetyltransferase
MSLLGLNYYCLGYFCRWKNIIANLQKLPSAVLFLLGLTGFLAVYILAKNGNVWYGGNSVYDYFKSFIGGAIGCLMITAISLLLEKIIGELKPIKFISLNTILILGFHGLFSNDLALRILSPFSLTPYFLKIFIATIFSITLLVPIIILINKFLPQINGRGPQEVSSF